MITHLQLITFMFGLRTLKVECDKAIISYPMLKLDRTTYRDLDRALAERHFCPTNTFFKYPPRLLGFEIILKDGDAHAMR